MEVKSIFVISIGLLPNINLQSLSSVSVQVSEMIICPSFASIVFPERVMLLSTIRIPLTSITDIESGMFRKEYFFADGIIIRLPISLELEISVFIPLMVILFDLQSIIAMVEIAIAKIIILKWYVNRFW